MWTDFTATVAVPESSFSFVSLRRQLCISTLSCADLFAPGKEKDSAFPLPGRDITTFTPIGLRWIASTR